MDKHIFINDINEQMNIWINEGYKMIYDAKRQEWYQYVKEKGGNVVNSFVIENTIKLMTMLDKGRSCATVTKVFNKIEFDRLSIKFIMELLLKFSKRGPEVYRYLYGYDLGYEKEHMIESIEAQNNRYIAIENNGMDK